MGLDTSPPFSYFLTMKVGQSKFLEGDKFLWKTKDGRTMKIGKMTNEHLVNAIRYFSESSLSLNLSEDQISRVQELSFELLKRSFNGLGPFVRALPFKILVEMASLIEQELAKRVD